jgi:hypothetical protein
VGLIGEVLLLPFAPVRGSAWVIRQVLDEAERLYCDPAAVRAELADLEEQLTSGEIDEEEFLDRLEIGLREGRGNSDGTTR